MAKTKKTTARKAVKKITKKSNAKEKRLKLALLKAENKAEELADKLNKALVVETKKSLVKPPFDLKVLLKMAEKTQPQYIKQRQGPGKIMLNYVEGGYVKTVLNYLFGWRWDFEIIDKGEVKVGNKTVQLWVQGKLTIRNKDNQAVISKMQFGGATVKYLKNSPTMPVDLPNDYKAAATDALKKCASELGIASDVYNRNEFVVSEVNENEEEVRETEEVKKETGIDYLSKLIKMLAKEAKVDVKNITKDDMEAMLTIYNNYTGESIKSLKVEQSTAKKYLLNFIGSPMMTNKK